MAEKSAIEWTDSSWNPITGCTKISQGCKNCYANRLAMRLQRMDPDGKYKNGFKLTTHEKDVGLPLRWKSPKVIFVNSMSDLFHKDVPDDFILKVFETMENAHWHIFQILTKRPERMNDFTNNIFKKELPNVWLGTSIEDDRVKNRIDYLKTTKAKVKFISFEPLIGPVGDIDLSGIHWAIVGGESGPDFREVEKKWIKEIRMQCRRDHVPFFFKQWGGVTSKSRGRELDGRVYDEYPKEYYEMIPNAR